MPDIRRCTPQDHPAVLRIINSAAEAYRGVIPADCWHEPYFPDAQLRDEVATGVEMWGFEVDSELVGVMGLQSLPDVDLIRHAYVLPAFQGQGIGSALLSHLRGRTGKRILIGTWAAAHWAIAFYQRHGFDLVPHDGAAALLDQYWMVPRRQREVSVVLRESGA